MQDEKPKKPHLVQRSESSKSDDEDEIEKLSFSLKQLIRKIHIAEPVAHVMAIVGKKYPDTLEEFYM